MSKRRHEVDSAQPDTPPKKSKTIHESSSKSLTLDEAEAKKLRKEAKRARKLAKVQAKLEKIERKKKKAENKAKAADEPDITASGFETEVTSAPSPSGSETLVAPTPIVLETSSKVQDDDSDRSFDSYVQHASLTNLPSSKTTTFYEENYIRILDSKSRNVGAEMTEHRPIHKFEYLPSDAHSYMSIFSSKFVNPTPIQAAAWPFLFSGKDLVGVAETGSGKTLAFGLPCILRVKKSLLKNKKGIKAVIVSPTRELAIQIFEQLEKLGTEANVNVTCVYGGVPKDQQRFALKKAHIVVATPGRLLDLMLENAADISGADYICLDEADRMLDKGFEEDIKKIMSSTRQDRTRQTVMFTATWPPSVKELASTFMKDYIQIAIGDRDNGELQANSRITQKIEVMDSNQKFGRLVDILQKRGHQEKILVFCLYKKEAARVERDLRGRRLKVCGIHGDMSQVARQAALESFKSGKAMVMVATDVAARGLDIPAVKLVLNLTFPLTIEDYVHRIGRTGRAGANGEAITFFTDFDKSHSGSLIAVLKSTNQPVPPELLKFGTTIKKKEHSAYGAFYKEPEEGMKKATMIKFD